MINQPATIRPAQTRSFIRPTMVAAAMVLALAAATAQGQLNMGQLNMGQVNMGQVNMGQMNLNQGLAPGETIISSQIVSDTAMESGSYAGDLPQSDCVGGNCGGGIAGGGEGLAAGRSYGQPDLFYNHYTQGNANTANAQMYVSPLPVPKSVGHTYNTYQPFYPEEYLYWHKNRFHKYYDNGRGMNRTKALYYSPPVRQAISNIYWNKLRIPR